MQTYFPLCTTICTNRIDKLFWGHNFAVCHILQRICGNAYDCALCTCDSLNESSNNPALVVHISITTRRKCSCLNQGGSTGCKIAYTVINRNHFVQHMTFHMRSKECSVTRAVEEAE